MRLGTEEQRTVEIVELELIGERRPEPEIVLEEDHRHALPSTLLLLSRTVREVRASDREERTVPVPDNIPTLNRPFLSEQVALLRPRHLCGVPTTCLLERPTEKGTRNTEESTLRRALNAEGVERQPTLPPHGPTCSNASLASVSAVSSVY